MVDVRADATLAQPVTLKQCRAEKAFDGSPLVREPRLSFLPLTPAQFKRLCALGGVRP